MTNLLNEWDHTAWLLLCTALTCGSFAMFAGTMWAKDSTELDSAVKITSLGGAGLLVVILPFILASYYGPNYEMSWVAVTAALSVLTSFYCYYDLLVYQDQELYRQDDYVMSALFMYIDFMKLLWEHAIKPCFWWAYGKY